MLTTRHDSILTALRSFPDGHATAKQIAAKLQWKNTAASRDMGIMFFANILDRRDIRRSCGDGQEFIYWIRAVVHPPTQIAWDGPVLVAGRRDMERV